MPQVKWSGRQFSMRRTNPADTPNPVTRTLNMVLDSRNRLVTRKAFTGSLTDAPQNHISVEIGGTPYLIIKTSTAVRALIAGVFTNLTATGADLPVGNCVPNATARGSFSMHSGDVYYCDQNTLFSWGGGTASSCRRPGVQSLEGKVYNGTGSAELPGGPFGHTDGYYQSVPANSPLHPTTDPGIKPALQAPFIGEKTLNTAFAFSYFDRKRKIYGKRCEAFAYPYVFGPPDPDGSNTILSDQRFQYSKFVKCPTAPAAHPEYEVAIWFSQGQAILTNIRSSVLNFPWVFFNEHEPGMSKRMTQLLFLENIVEAGLDDVECVKDNATLVQSARYIDAYDRPLPAKFMMVLPSGIGIYFFPWAKNPEDGGGASDLANYAEFSVGHPEQIGRNTATQRDTNSPLPNLRGTPLATVSEGDIQMLLTGQAAYMVGFSGQGVSLSETLNGYGVRALRSIASGSPGTLWVADEGVVFLRRGGLKLLDSELGLSDWYSDLTTSQKTNVVIGICESTQEIMVFSDCTDDVPPDGANKHALVHNYYDGFVSEFTDIGGTPTYACYHRGTAGGIDTNDDAKLFVFGVGKYPGESTANCKSMVEFWLSEQPDQVKVIKSVILDLGACDGTLRLDMTIQHSASEDEPIANKPTHETRTQTVPNTSGDGSGRYTLTDFSGFRGRMFKCLLYGDTGDALAIHSVTINYERVEGSDERTV